MILFAIHELVIEMKQLERRLTLYEEKPEIDKLRAWLNQRLIST